MIKIVQTVGLSLWHCSFILSVINLSTEVWTVITGYVAFCKFYNIKEKLEIFYYIKFYRFPRLYTMIIDFKNMLFPPSLQLYFLLLHFQMTKT